MMQCIKRKFPKNQYANLHVRSTHNYRKLNESNVTLHYHPTPEVYVFLTGICRVQLNNCIHLLSRGTMIWLAPGQAHIIRDQSFDCTFVVCSLMPQFFKKFEMQEVFPSETKIFKISEEEVVYLEHFFTTFPPRNHPVRIAAVHYGTDHLLRLLKHNVLTETHILSGKLFFPATARSEERRDWRSDAKKYCDISEVVYQAGFGSYAQFYRVFTKITGYTPRAFQRLCASQYQPNIRTYS